MNQSMIGHNNPPVPIAPSEEDVKFYLDEATERVVERKAELLSDKPVQGHVCHDEQEAERLTEYIKNVNNCAKTFEEIRKKEKQPYYNIGKLIDGFFKSHSNDLDLAKALAQKPLNVFMQKKVEEERKRREEEAERLRIEAEKKTQEAIQASEAGAEQLADQALKEAEQTERKAEKYEKSAASGRGLGSTRGLSGGVASVRRKWVGEIDDVDLIDLEALRHFIDRSALESAINRYVAQGNRSLRGAKIYEKVETVVR